MHAEAVEGALQGLAEQQVQTESYQLLCPNLQRSEPRQVDSPTPLLLPLQERRPPSRKARQHLGLRPEVREDEKAQAQPPVVLPERPVKAQKEIVAPPLAPENSLLAGIKPPV